MKFHLFCDTTIIYQYKNQRIIMTEKRKNIIGELSNDDEILWGSTNVHVVCVQKY